MFFFLLVPHLHGWTRLNVQLTQVDSGITSLVWGINQNQKLFSLTDENELRPVLPSMITIRHVTAGQAGVWAIDITGRVYFRIGVSALNLKGKHSLE